MKPVIIFGNLASASTSKYYLETDSPYQVLAFTVDELHLTASKYEGLNVIPFDKIHKEFPPNEVSFLFPAGYQHDNPRNTNIFRRSRYELIKSLGYEFISYISSKAIVASNAQLGDNVLIYEGAIVQPFVQIGNNTIIRSGVNVGHHCTVGDHSFVSAEVTIGSKTQIGTQVFVGLNSTISNSIKVADSAFIGANSFINRDT